MENINTHLLDLDGVIKNLKNYIREIGYKLGDKNIEDAMYIGLIILKKLCEKSANVECKYDLSEKPPILYNLRENDLKKIVGKAFLGIAPYFESRSRIPYDHIRYLEYKVNLIIDDFSDELSHYKSLEKRKIEIENKLGEIYQTVGSEILRKLEEMNMIEIIKTKKHENPPVYVKILDNAYKFMEKYEEYRTTDSEYEYKIMEYD
jgi:hypothetical protein